MRKCYCILLGIFTFVLAGRELQANTRIFWMAEGPLIADFDGNGRVDFADFLLFLNSFNTQADDSNYDPRLDINGDGIINFSDFLSFASSYGYAQAPVAPTSGARYAIYVADTDDSSVSVLASESHLMFDYLPFRLPESVLISADQQRIYVAEDFGFFTLDTRHEVIFRVPVESRGSVALSPDGTRAYVTDRFANRLRVIDLIQGVTLDSVGVGLRPMDVAITPDGRKLYVASQVDENITVVDVASTRVIATIVIGATPGVIRFAPNGQRAYVTNLNRGVITVIDVNTDRVVGAVQLDQDRAFGAQLSPDGSVLYVAAEGSLLAIDVQRNLIQRSLKVADETSVLGIMPDGSRAYIGSLDFFSGGPGITVVDLQTWQVLGRLRGFFFPRYISFRTLPAEPVNAQ